MKKNQEYNIGLDIGTESVGWAVVECDNQKIVRKGNKRLWGVRLFDAANPAEERRSFRSTRRRYNKRRERIKLLREEFNCEMKKVDPNFFNALKEGFYNEKKDFINVKYKKNDIFKNFMINDYQKKYKTIYHLRNELINNPKKKDIRLVYLAIHHIIKYRGNFLYQNQNFNVNNLEIDKCFEDFLLQYIKDCNLDVSFQDYKILEKSVLLNNKNDIKVELKKNLKELNDSFDVDVVTQIVNAIIGNDFDLKKLFSLEIEEKDFKISFAKNSFEEKYSDVESICGDYLESLNLLKSLYNAIILKRLFKNCGSSSISEAMIKKYAKHENDLSYLKSLLKSDSLEYKKMFKDNKKEDCFYTKYIKNKIDYNDFIKSFKNKITDEEILNIINNGEFLPRITTTDNGVFPYQLNESELIKIIENQGKYYPFLLDKIDDDYRICKILKFKIPYYVGPLITNNTSSEFAWLTRKSNERITPFNFDKVVDKEQTAMDFITRMVGKCTYLLGENAIPANSILYSKFKVLNELKQIKVNNKKLNIDLQHKIYNELFLRNSGTITEKKFIDFLKSNNEFNFLGNEIKITGYSSDKKFANNMQSYVDFFGENGFFKDTVYKEEAAEEIIKWITVYEDKDILKSQLEKKYSNLSDFTIKRIVNKKYKGWGSLSKKLLLEITCLDKTTSIYKSIMDLMWENDKNFNQIMFDSSYMLQDKINEFNTNKIEGSKLSYDLVKDLVTSPRVKRGIYQSLKIIDELVNYIGYNPKNISIEFAREEEMFKKRTNNRYKQLLTLYEKNKENIVYYNDLIKELNLYSDNNNQIDDKLFLYFIQEGKCLYSGKRIDINELNNNSLLEIDHIIPRTLIKDNSLDNRCLVYREYNQEKKDSFVLPKKYRDENITWWNSLKERGLISNSKFYRLTRNEYKDEDIEGFINRQLVETRQISKHVANILSNLYDKTNIIYLKADFSHNYREAFELFKFREINDYHHAHDAYLAAVLGEYREKVFNKNNSLSYELAKEYNIRARKSKNYEALKFGYALNMLLQEENIVNHKTGEILIQVDKFNNTIINNMYCNDILLTKKVENRLGQFYDQNPTNKDNAKVSLNNKLPKELYGGYDNVQPTCAALIEYQSKNKIVRKMIGRPIYTIHDDNAYNEYVMRICNLKPENTFKIVYDNIPFNSLLNWNNQICYLTGASDKVEVYNGKQFIYSRDKYKKFKYALYKLFVKNSIEVDNYSELLNQIIEYIVNKIKDEYILYNNLIESLNDMIIGKLNDISLEDKEEIVKQLHILLKCNSKTANFKFLNSSYSSTFGRKNEKVINNTIIINQSITGIHESKVNTNEF